MIYNSLKALQHFVSIERGLGKRIVTTNGCFDLLHIGHAKFLHEASIQGDVLIVGVNSDRSIRKRKGGKRPIISEKHRAHLVSALRCVDAVYIFNEDDPRAIIEAVKPDVHMTSAEYLPCAIEDALVRSYGGKIIYQKRFSGLQSTSQIIERICNL